MINLTQASCPDDIVHTAEVAFAHGPMMEMLESRERARRGSAHLDAVATGRIAESTRKVVQATQEEEWTASLLPPVKGWLHA